MGAAAAHPVATFTGRITAEPDPMSRETAGAAPKGVLLVALRNP